MKFIFIFLLPTLVHLIKLHCLYWKLTSVRIKYEYISACQVFNQGTLPQLKTFYPQTLKRTPINMDASCFSISQV